MSNPKSFGLLKHPFGSPTTDGNGEEGVRCKREKGGPATSGFKQKDKITALATGWHKVLFKRREEETGGVLVLITFENRARAGRSEQAGSNGFFDLA